MRTNKLLWRANRPSGGASRSDFLILITGQYPQINSNVQDVNVQYHMSDFLEIVSIDILGHGGAMNIILPKNLF